MLEVSHKPAVIKFTTSMLPHAAASQWQDWQLITSAPARAMFGCQPVAR